MADMESAMKKVCGSLVTGKNAVAMEEVDKSTLPPVTSNSGREVDRRPARKAEAPATKPKGPRVADITLITMPGDALRNAVQTHGREIRDEAHNRSWKELYLTPLRDVVLTKEAMGSEDPRKRHPQGLTIVATEQRSGDIFLKVHRAVGKYAKYDMFMRGRSSEGLATKATTIPHEFFLAVYKTAEKIERSADGKLRYEFDMRNRAIADALLDRNGNPLPEDVDVMRRTLVVALANDIKRTENWLSKRQEEKAREKSRLEKIAAAVKECPTVVMEISGFASPKQASTRHVSKKGKKPERAEKPKRFQVPEGFDPALPRIVARGTEKDLRDRLAYEGCTGKGLVFDFNDGPSEASVFEFRLIVSESGAVVVSSEEMTVSGHFVDLCADVDSPETTYDALRQVIEGNEDGADNFALALGRAFRGAFRKEVVAPKPETVEAVREDQAKAGAEMSADEVAPIEDVCRLPLVITREEPTSSGDVAEGKAE